MTALSFAPCINTGFYLRLGLLGPSGSGKTYTALKVATELGFEHVGIIDTENRSARRYAKSFARRFSTLELPSFSPQSYVEALHIAADCGLQVLVVDSLSHAWMGKGGVLDMVDQSAKRQARGAGGSSFNGWREVTPEHNRLVEALVRAPLHLIVTMRVKTEYVVETDQRGKSVPRKVGLAPVQRDGLEYEFDVIGDLSLDHELLITKTRCSALKDAVISHPGAELAQTLRGWLDGAEPAPAAAPEPVVVRDTPATEGAPAEPRRGLLEVMRADLETCATSAQVKAVYQRAEAAIDASAKPPHVKATLLTKAGRLAADREEALRLGKVGAAVQAASPPRADRPAGGGDGD